MKMVVMKFAEKKLLELLKNINNTFSGVYIVGGFVRDVVLKRVNDTDVDIDIIIHNLSVKKLAQIIKKHNLPFVILDEENKIYRTVISLTDGRRITLDFSSYTDFSQDIMRRDFTINTLCLKLEDFIELATGRKNYKSVLKSIIDYTQCGLKDIHRRILQETQEGNIIKDPLRILRVARFMCYGFKPSKKLTMTCVKNKSTLKLVARERINDELKKIFNFNPSFKIFEWLDNNGIFEEIIPEIKIIKTKGKNTQFRKFYFHKEGLWQHTKLTYKYTEDVIKKIKKFYPKYYDKIRNEIADKEYLLKYIALLHDIGKPFVARKIKGRVRFFQHEIYSANLVEKILQNLRLSNEDQKSIVSVVRNHMRLGSLYNGRNQLTERAYLRLFRDLGSDLFYLLIFSLADRLSYEVIPISERKKFIKDCDIKEFIKFENLILDKYFDYLKKTSMPRLITGHDVMKIFGIPEGPTVGKILNFVREAQLLGKVSTREQALQLAKKYLSMLK